MLSANAVKSRRKIIVPSSAAPHRTAPPTEFTGARPEALRLVISGNSKVNG